MVRGMKLFFLFFGKSRPSLFRNKGRMAFFLVFYLFIIIIFCIFLEMLQLGSGRNGIQNEFVFLSFILSRSGLASKAKNIWSHDHGDCESEG